MNGNRSGMKRAVFVALAACLVVAACSSAKVTPPPVATPTPTDVATDTPAATDTPIATSTPVATPTPAAPSSASPVPTPTPAPSDTPTPGPSASTPSTASACTGTTDIQGYFADAAVELPFDVYCGSLPSKWYLQSTAFTVPHGGQLTIQYKRFSGGQLDISEGAFCTSSPAACSPNVGVIGTASFGGLSGSLEKFSASPDVFIIYVAPGTTNAYSIKGTNISQAEFVSLAADMVKVPRS